MVPTKEMTPYVPVRPNEIIEQTHEAYELGITIVHVHARDENGDPTWKPEIYQQIIEGIRKHCPDLVICASTSGRTFSEFEKRAAVIELKPDMCSLTLSSLNFPKSASVNDPDTVKKLALKMRDYGVHPELECFDLGMINVGKYLIQKNILEPPYYWNLLFGNVSGFQADFLQIGTALSQFGEDQLVALTGLGDTQLAVQASAIAMGYGVRVGLEDNIWLDDGRTKLASNYQLLERIHTLMELHERELMTPKELGELGFYNEKKSTESKS